MTRRPFLRLPRPSDDRGSMPMLMMVTIIGLALGALLVPMVITQDRGTRFSVTRVHALDAAQAGIDVAVGKIRAAADSLGSGDVSGLPCAPAEKMIEGLANSNGPAAYQVTIVYYQSDPVQYPSQEPMICAPGYGTYDPNTNERTPRYAQITSVGTDGNTGNGATRGRTLVATYKFKTDDVNILGGVFRIFPSGSDQYCMDAGSATPTAGTPVRVQPCSTAVPPAAQQVFAYRSDLSIQLVSSAVNGLPGLCLDSATPHAPGNPVYLNTCAALGSAPYRQKWSIDDNAHLEGAKSDNSDIDGFCVNVAGQAPGIALTLQYCAGGVTDPFQTWVPSPTSGSGMAGATNKQLVNYKQFGTCLDVTGQSVNSTFLILYTCKQNPDPTKVRWNQQFTPNPALAATGPTIGEWVTTSNGTRYCLRSPKTVGGYVTVTAGDCPTGVPASTSNVRWTTYREKDAAGNELTYDLKYTIHDSAGYCLSLGPNSDMFNGQYLKAIVDTCDGSTAQKWNADPSVLISAVQNTTEE